MATPTPNHTFQYAYSLTPNGNGSYTIGTGTSTATSVYDNVDDSYPGHPDSPTQLGDVGLDQFTLNNSQLGASIAGYHGDIPDGAIVAFVPGTPGSGYYLFSDKAETQGTTVAPSYAAPYDIACFVTGTLIRTSRGDVPVETLAIGDLAVTASGAHRPIKWIGHRAYAARFAGSNPDVLPICFKAGSLADGVPARDLRVSPKHAMFLDGVLVPAEQLVNGVTIVKAEEVTDAVEYWHIELDSHDILLAENTPTESYLDDDNRGIFHNAGSFRMLFPDAVEVEPVYFAPRVESGHVLAAVRRRLAERAGLPVPTAAPFGDLHGHVDLCGDGVVAGWARDTLYPDAAVCLDVLVDGVLVELLYADRHRPDLESAGIGDGCHAFHLDLPLDPAIDHRVEVRRSADGAALPGSPRLVPARVDRAA